MISNILAKEDMEKIGITNPIEQKYMEKEIEELKKRF